MLQTEGRLLSKTYSDGTTPQVTFTYDAVGRLLTAANGTDTLTWAYDLAGQLLSEQSSRNASTVAYTYDTGGNRITIGLNGTLFVTYAYDDASRLTTITRGTDAFSFGYDNANRRTSMSYPNGVATTYAYDTLNRLTSLGAAAGTTTITGFTYAYDAAGNRTSKAEPDQTESYGYDALSRLTEVGRSGATPQSTFYTYDPVGNRLAEQVDQTATSATYDARNRLLSTTGGGPLHIRGHLDEPGTVTVNGQAARMLGGNVFDATINATPGPNTITVTATDVSGNPSTHSWSVTVPSASANYSYDANGNLTSKADGTDTWTYEWNAENQLTRVLKNGAEVARYAYDPLGRRVEKVAGGVTKTYTYDVDKILRETSSTGTTLTYVHGPGADEPLTSEDQNGMRTYLHADGLGSVVKTTNTAGTVTSTLKYNAFGVLESGTPNLFAYTGREWDSEAGLYGYRARYYDPRSGRFLSQDPLFFEGPNLYSYVDNNPVNWIDPSGEAKGGKQNITVTDHRTGRTLTKSSPISEIEACLRDAIEKVMSPQHIRKLEGLRKVVKRGGGMALASPYIIDTSIAEWDRYKRAQSCPNGGCTMQQQLCKDLEEEGNPDFVLSPVGLIPNPCKCSPFNRAACGT